MAKSINTSRKKEISDIQGTTILEKARKNHKNNDLRAADIQLKELFVAVKDYVLDSASSKVLFYCAY